MFKCNKRFFYENNLSDFIQYTIRSESRTLGKTEPNLCSPVLREIKRDSRWPGRKRITIYASFMSALGVAVKIFMNKNNVKAERKNL